MRERLLELKAWIAPYATELKIAASVIGVVALAFALRYAVNRLLRRFFMAVADRAPTIEERRRVATVSKVLRHTVSALILVVAAMLVLGQIGFSIAPILGAAGVVGIAVGFGAQSLVKDVFAGFFLLIENQIRVGDVVEIAGKSGVVEQLSLRRTKLRSYDGSVHYISNGLITTVTNMSTEFAFAVVDIGVSYREDIDRVYAVMREESGFDPSAVSPADAYGLMQLIVPTAKLIAKPPAADELRKAKNQVLSAFVFGLDSPLGLAEQIGQSWILTGDPGQFLRDVDAIERVTAADLARVAKTYLTPERATVVVVPPRSAP